MSQLKLTLITDPSKFKQGIDAGIKELKGLQRTTKSVADGMNKALGAVGLGMGLKALTGFLKESAKAAIEDGKSKQLLGLALQNTVGASKSAIDATEQWIQKTAFATAVLDDELRPALSKAVRATGDLASAQALLKLGLDVSAGSGKGLDTVMTALGKAYNGNTGALQKLGIFVKDATHWQDELAKSYEGSAEAVANADPFMRLNQIMDSLKETVGNELLPELQKFNEWLATPEGQASIKQIADTFVFIAKAVGAVIGYVVQNIGFFKALAVTIISVKVAIATMTFAMKLYEIATKIAKIETIALRTAIMSTGIGALVVAVGLLAGMWMEASASATAYGDAVDEATTTTLADLDPNNLPFGMTNTANSTTFWNTTYKNGVYTGLKSVLADPRLTEEMKDVLQKNLGKKLNIDWLFGRIFEVDSAGKYHKIYQRVSDAMQAVSDAVNKQIEKMKQTGDKFREQFGLAFGVFGKDENTIFNVDYMIDRMRAVLQAAKGFGDNLAALAKVPGWSDALSAQLVAMGPAQGNIVAQGLLANPSQLSEFVNLSGQLYTTGASAQGQVALTPSATYEININKATITAADIIAEIKKYEKKTGRKYLVG